MGAGTASSKASVKSRHLLETERGLAYFHPKSRLPLHLAHQILSYRPFSLIWQSPFRILGLPFARVTLSRLIVSSERSDLTGSYERTRS